MRKINRPPDVYREETDLHDLLETHIPAQPFLCSWQAGWRGLLVRQYCHTTPIDKVTFPSMNADLILLHLGQSTPVEYTIGKQYSQKGYAVSGSLALLPRGKSSVWHWKKSTDVLHIYLLPHVTHQIVAELIELDCQQPTLLNRLLVQDLFIYQIGLELQKSLKSVNLATTLYVQLLIQCLAVHLIRNHSTLCPGNNKLDQSYTDYRIQKARDYIHTSLDQEITLSDLENLLGISQYHFIRLFKSAVGIPPYQYILQQRIKAAKRLLLAQTNLSITDVAMQCGFSSSSHFSRSFQKLVGISPRVYRGL